jgi:magnesium transporter
MSSISNRLNDIVRVLAIISTIFVPLTFLAGVYGMNMPIPENGSAWMYPIFWTACLAVAGTMLSCSGGGAGSAPWGQVRDAV